MYNPQKKVLILIDSLGCGGAEKSLISLLPLLDYTKVSVDLMMVSRGGVFEKYIPSEVNIVPFPVNNSNTVFFALCQLLFSILIRLLPQRHGAELRWESMHNVYPKCEQEYDVAIAYQQGFPTYYIVEKVTAARKYAWINVDIRKAGYRASFNRSYYDKMTKVIAVSDTLFDMLSEDDYVGKDKLIMVRDIVNEDVVTKMSLEQGFTDNVNNNNFRIVTVGRLVTQKNYLLAVETAKILKERGLLFRWYFVGEGNERQKIEKKVSEYGLQQEVILLGLQSNPYPYMRQCDIYVQTSSFEGFGLTISEAMILHKPIVSTNFNVVYDQIENGVNGIVTEMKPENLCEGILSLVKDEGLRKKIVEGTYRIKNNTVITESVKVNSLINA